MRRRLYSPGMRRRICDVEAGEQCEDGNSDDDDGCSANCLSDETCGNGVLDTVKGEVCDDGNQIDGDDCSSNCMSDESCGNGIVDAAAGELCDGGDMDADGEADKHGDVR